MRKILCISHSTCLHGAERVFVQAIQAWRSSGAEVWVVFPSILPDEGMIDQLKQLVGADHILLLPYRPAGISLWRTRMVMLYNRYAVRKLSRWMQEHAIDTVYSNTSITILGAQLVQRTGIRHIWHFHEPVNALYGWEPELRDVYRRWVNRPGTSLVFISQQQRQEWESELGQACPGTVIYNPIAAIEMPVAEPHETLRIGFIGHFESRKNIRLLVRAFARFQPTHPQSELWLCGAIDEAEKRDWELDCASTTNVRITLHTNDVGAFYSNIDILALPSFSETMPLVTIEAMQAGVCVLQTTESGMSELYTNEKECLFLSPNDEDAWVEALNRCADKTYRCRMALNGKKKTEAYDFNRQFEQQIQHILCE